MLEISPPPPADIRYHLVDLPDAVEPCSQYYTVFIDARVLGGRGVIVCPSHPPANIVQHNVDWWVTVTTVNHVHPELTGRFMTSDLVLFVT